MAGLLNTGSFSAHNAEQQRLTSEPSFRTTPGESWCLLNFASPTCTTLCHERKNKKPSTPLDTAPAEPHEVLYDCFHSPTDWLVPHLTRELTVADSSSSGSNANTPVHHFSFSLFLRLVFLNVRWRVICFSSSWCIDYAGVQCDSYGTMTPSRKMTLYLLSRLHYRLNKRMHEVTFRPVLSAVTTLRKLETILLSFATTAPAITPLENARKEGGGVSAITFIYFYLRLGNRTMHWISSCCYWAKKPRPMWSRPDRSSEQRLSLAVEALLHLQEIIEKVSDSLSGSPLVFFLCQTTWNPDRRSCMTSMRGIQRKQRVVYLQENDADYEVEKCVYS